MIDKSQITSWGGWVLGGLGAIGAALNRLKLKSLEIKTDGMLQYRSRADRAEAVVDEKNAARDHAEGREKQP